MTLDKSAQADLAEKWQDVRRLQEGVKVNFFATRGRGIRLANLAYSLLLFHAYAVLEDVLDAYAKSGHIPEKGGLKDKMKVSRRCIQMD